MNALLQGWKKLFAALPIAGASAAQSQDLDRAVVLVAQPNLQGPYARTTLLAVPGANGQHFGFIINRALDVKLATLFPEHAPSAKVVDPLYFGGPEMVGSIFAIVHGNPGAPSVHLFGDLFVTGNGASIDRIIEQTPNDARYFAGFVGWQVGELAKELEAGYWYVTEPDATLVFSDQSGAMWEELMKRVGRSGMLPGSI